MTEPELNALVDELIALLAEARRERDGHKQQVVDLSHALLHEQMANADLLAALEQAGRELEEAGKLISASTIGGQNMTGTGGLFSEASAKALAVVAKAKAGKE